MRQAIPETAPDYDETRIIEGPDWIDQETGEPAEERPPRLNEH